MASFAYKLENAVVAKGDIEVSKKKLWLAMDPALRLSLIPQEISQAEEEKLECEQLLGLFWEHPPALDPEVVGNMMQLTRGRIRGLEDRIRALLAEQKELIVRAATLGDRGD